MSMYWIFQNTSSNSAGLFLTQSTHDDSVFAWHPPLGQMPGLPAASPQNVMSSTIFMLLKARSTSQVLEVTAK